MAETDWSSALVASRGPEPADLAWGYQAAFYLAGLYQVTRRGEEALPASVREYYWRVSSAGLWRMSSRTAAWSSMAARYRSMR